MATSYVLNIGWTDHLATHEIAPVLPHRDAAPPFSTMEPVDTTLSDPPVVRHARRTNVAQQVSADSVAIRWKIATSRDKLNVIENCLLAVFVCVVVILATITLSVTNSYASMPTCAGFDNATAIVEAAATTTMG